MDETEKIEVTVREATRPKLLGLDGKDIAGVTRKMRPMDSVPLTSVADMTINEVDEVEEEAVVQRQTKVTVHNTYFDDVEAQQERGSLTQHMDVYSRGWCNCFLRKTIVQRLMASVAAIFVIVVIVVLEGYIKGKVVDSEQILKAVKSEMDTLVDTLPIDKVLRSVTRNLTLNI